MRHKPMKRIAALALTLVMLLSCIPVTTWAVDSTTDIKAIAKPTGISIVEDYDDYVGENWLNELGLPTEVTVTLADGSTAQAAVTWDTTVLDPRTVGYYYLPGTVTLPDGATNGQNLEVSITVQVREYENLISNPSFESNTVGWYFRGTNPSPGRVQTPVKEGSYAAHTGTWTVTAKQSSVADTRNMVNDMGAAVGALGGGQFYYSISAQYSAEEMPEGMQIQTYLFYKTNNNGTLSSAITKTSEKAALSNTAYAEAAGYLTLPENTAWVRMDLYIFAQDASHIGKIVYIDDAKLVALKTALKAEPSAIKEIKSELLSHKVVLNYPDYVGENWQEELGLPTTVEIETDTGSAVEVGVTWDYSVIDFTTYGKYTLTGTLDDSDFPNPKGIVAAQNIYVTRAENLIPNPGFESDTVGWYFRGMNPNPGRVQTPVKEGSYAAHTGTWTVTAKQSSVADTRNMANEMGAAVGALGGGQFYYSISAQYSAEEMPEGMQIQTYLLYKTNNNGTLSSSITKTSQKAALSNTAYAEAAGYLTLPENTAWVRMDLYIFAQDASHIGKIVYIDDAKLIPLNVTIPKDQEPEEVAEIVEEIPVRAIVVNYNEYVGENWQSAMGLPKSVQVLTASGKSASVDVEWNYETLKLDKEGKYILVGTLDSSVYPNPNELTVTQTIYVREYKNLVSNPSFESGLSNWYLRGANPSPSTVTNVVKDGKYAAMTGLLVSTAKVTSIADTRQTVDTVGAAVAQEGAGQYYYSAWVRSASKTLIDGMSTDIRLLYKVNDEQGELIDTSITKIGDKATLTNTEFAHTKGVVELPETTAWVRLDLYAEAQSAEDLCAAAYYIDKVELIPLNVIVEQYEGQMVQVESVIPDRQIIVNFPDYIGEGYTTADLMLPETVEVRSSIGEIVDVTVKWDYSTLDLTKIGTYTVYGTLNEMKLPNPDALTVKQTIHVVAKQNLFSNPSFENDDAGWDARSDAKLEVAITKPVRTGDYSVKFTSGRMDDWTRNNLQSFYNTGPDTVGQKITQTGGGLYYFGGWAQGTESTNDIQVQLKMLYRNMENGDKVTTTSAPGIALSTTQFSQMGDLVTMPDDVYWARADFYLLGTPEQMRLSEVYLDDFELIPLNVEVPNLTDIISCENVADIYVHEGSSVEDLDLPETLEVVIKTGQKFNLEVIWDTESFDPNQIGVQTVKGELNIGSVYENPKNFVPTAKITVRAKGEDLRQTIYISTSGSEDNDGLSPETPKKDVSKIAAYLQQGCNVKLKRGDTWYLNSQTFTWSNIYGTENVPLVVGAYGSGDTKPCIAFEKKIENNAWTLVDESRNIYAADVSDMGSKYGYYVHRCFMGEESLTPKARTNYKTLKDGEFCSYDGMLYVRVPAGEVPRNVEAVPFLAGNRIYIQNVSYLTVENIHFMGTDAIWNLIYADAPTKYLKFLYCDMTRISGHAMMWEADGEEIHYKPEIAYCYIDTSISEEEGKIRGGTYWDCHHLEGITIRDGVDGAWIHNCTMRQFSHCFIAIESLTMASDYTTTGVRNCVFEDNVLEGGNACYARAVTLSGGYNLSGVQMCRNNIFRRNYCYDMTTAGHFFGENNLIYSNLISYVHCVYTEDGELFDGKNAQPFGFDTKIYSGKGSVGNMLINNTFFNVGGALIIEDLTGGVYNNIYANNLVVNWTSDAAVNNAHGAFCDTSLEVQYMMNNGLYSTIGLNDHFVVDGLSYTAEDANKAIAGYSGNIAADPMFVSVDLSNMTHGARMDFTLSSESPMRYAGLSLKSSIYQTFPMWEKLMEDYTDINGVLYLAESPSIGCYSYSEKIKGDVAEVGKLEDILARPGATIEQLNLPDAVPATNDQGIEVMLLTDWSLADFDSSKPGTVTLTAQLYNGPHTELNINGKVATININIKDKLELLSVTTVLKNITVLYGTSLEDALKQLPAVLDVQEESGYQEMLPVTWSCENYDPTTPDSYTFKCILPADMISNTKEFSLSVEVRVLHEIGRGMELLVNPDFIDGTSASPWKIGYGTGSFKVTTDPAYVYPGEPSAAIVTADRVYASIQQDVVGQMQLMGNGKYLFRMYMRAYDPSAPIDSTVPCLKVYTPTNYTKFSRTRTNVGTDWVEFYTVMDVTNIELATQVDFHTSTYKSNDDVEEQRSYIISGCSLIYLGNTDEEVEATLDSIELDWNMIKGENGLDMDNVTSDLELPSKIGEGSTIKWTSSDESVITNDGKVTMGRVPKTVQMVATITYNGIETVKKFNITVPRNPDLPTFSGAISGSQTVNVGDEFQVTISLAGEKASAFNAYRFTFSFNTSKLEYIGCSDAASTVEVDGGKITVSGIGTERPITDTITLTFKAKKSGITEVKLVKVEMDLDANATLDNLPTMTVTEGAALIDVQKVEETDGTAAAENDNSGVIWIVIGLVAAALLCGGAIAIILIKKKKQTPPSEN